MHAHNHDSKSKTWNYTLYTRRPCTVCILAVICNSLFQVRVFVYLFHAVRMYECLYWKLCVCAGVSTWYWCIFCPLLSLFPFFQLYTWVCFIFHYSFIHRYLYSRVSKHFCFVACMVEEKREKKKKTIKQHNILHFFQNFSYTQCVCVSFDGKRRKNS